jgi:rare lipoprotein A
LAECGIASTYTPKSQEGGKTQRPMDISAAHHSLPPGTRVVVRSQRKGRSIIVRIAERNPSLLGVIIDLSADAMHALGIEVLSPVCLEVVTYGSKKRGYEMPSLGGRLLEAVHPAGRHYVGAHSRTPSARAGSGSRSAKVHHVRRHHTAARYGSRKRYAKLHRSRSLRGLRHRRRLAARG